jgi:hypothetical protein
LKIRVKWRIDCASNAATKGAAMKAFVIAAVLAVGLAVAGNYVLSENFQQYVEQAFATTGVRL